MSPPHGQQADQHPKTKGGSDGLIRMPSDGLVGRFGGGGALRLETITKCFGFVDGTVEFYSKVGPIQSYTF